MHRIPALWCLLAAFLFGAATPASKALLGAIPPVTLAGLLYLGAGLAMLPFAFRRGAGRLPPDRTNLLRLLGAVAFGGAVAPVFLLAGLARAPAASVALWLNLEVIATAVLAWAFFREHLDARAWIAVGVVLLAGALLAGPSSLGTASAALLVACACVCWGFDNNLTSLIDGCTPAQYTLVKGLAAGAWNLGLGLAMEGPSLHWPVVVVALAVGALTYGLSLVLYVAGAQQLGAARSQMLFAASPFLGGLLSWMALGEPIQPLQLVAVLLMMAGMATFLSARHGHVHAHEATTHTHSHRHDDGHHEHAHEGLPAHARHTHPHTHETLTHVHPHAPDLHHRHEH